MKEPQIALDTIAIPVFVPTLTIEKYAHSIGVSPDVVDGWIKRGYIPTVKIGRRRLVNIAALTRELSV
jgi:excisionase family DNA binding protein